MVLSYCIGVTLYYFILIIFIIFGVVCSMRVCWTTYFWMEHGCSFKTTIHLYVHVGPCCLRVSKKYTWRVTLVLRFENGWISLLFKLANYHGLLLVSFIVCIQAPSELHLQTQNGQCWFISYFKAKSNILKNLTTIFLTIYKILHIMCPTDYKFFNWIYYVK